MLLPTVECVEKTGFVHRKWPKNSLKESDRAKQMRERVKAILNFLLGKPHLNLMHNEKNAQYLQILCGN
jgi:hypothetical protein